MSFANGKNNGSGVYPASRSKTRLDVESEHRKIHSTISHSPASNATSDAQRFGHATGNNGRLRSTVTASLSGSGPAAPHNVSVQSLVGKLPSGKNQAMPMSGMAKPKVSGREGGPGPKMGVPAGHSSMTPPATRSAYRGRTALKVGGPK